LLQLRTKQYVPENRQGHHDASLDDILYYSILPLHRLPNLSSLQLLLKAQLLFHKIYVGRSRCQLKLIFL